MQDNIAIRVKNLTKVYHLYDKPSDRLKEVLHPRRKSYHHDFYALNDVSFEIKKGETVGIIGKNGAGKSTLLKIITGVLTQSSGEVEVNGKIASLLELGAGFNPEMTGIENIYLNGTLMGFTHEEMEQKVDAILEFADIGEFIHQPVKMYSSGMFARLAFSVAINVEPDILIVDEVLSVGDVAFQVKCFKRFRDFKARGKTILFVSHSTDQITQLCSRAIWFESGKLHKIGPAKEVASEYHAFMVHGVSTKSITKDTKQKNVSKKTFIELPPLRKGIQWSGDGGMQLIGIGLYDDEELMTTFTSSTKVKLVYSFETLTYVFNPFVSFIIIDKVGNRIIGASSITEEKQFNSIEEANMVKVEFSFEMPELANGEYLISVGLNDGNQEEHIRHQYIDDAYKFAFSSTSAKQKQATMVKLKDIDIKVVDE